MGLDPRNRTTRVDNTRNPSTGSVDPATTGIDGKKTTGTPVINNAEEDRFVNQPGNTTTNQEGDNSLAESLMAQLKVYFNRAIALIRAPLNTNPMFAIAFYTTLQSIMQSAASTIQQIIGVAVKGGQIQRNALELDARIKTTLSIATDGVTSAKEAQQAEKTESKAMGNLSHPT